MPDLPSEPSLQQLRHQARDLQRAVRRGDQDALAEVARRHPAGGPAGAPDGPPDGPRDGAAAAAFPLSAAQLVVARRYDFPELGQFRCEPLFYLAYARHDPAIGEAAVLGAVRMLLQAGADPNAGYLWHGLPTPFTVLTGVFGEGELGPVRQPRHPHALALARLLLEAGADPNDGQALYNRMFGPGNDHLELLFEFGLGAGFDVNARGRSDVPAADPWQTALHVAAMDGRLDLARSLLRLGADPAIRDQRFDSTPLGWARYFGQEQLVTLLEPLTAPEEP